jgi:hypothetical protein
VEAGDCLDEAEAVTLERVPGAAVAKEVRELIEAGIGGTRGGATGGDDRVERPTSGGAVAWDWSRAEVKGEALVRSVGWIKGEGSVTESEEAELGMWREAGVEAGTGKGGTAEAGAKVVWSG